MFNLFKSKEEKRQEQIAEYIDQQMGQSERNRFEALLNQDADLQADVDAQQEVKALLSQAPRLKAPRNFVLDPAVYGGKAPAPSFIELLYPKMRVASAAVSFMFVILLGVGILQSGAGSVTNSSSQMADDVALLPAADEAASSAESAPAIAATAVLVEGQPTPVPIATASAQQEKVEILSDGEAAAVEVEAEIEEELMAEVAADEAPENGNFAAVESDDAASASMSEADAGAAPPEPEAIVVSPREAAPAELEGERVAEMDSEPVPDPAQTIAPEPTQVLLDQTQTAPNEVAERAAVPEEDLSLQNTAESGSASTGSIAVWILGILSLALIMATFVMRRRMN